MVAPYGEDCERNKGGENNCYLREQYWLAYKRWKNYQGLYMCTHKMHTQPLLLTWSKLIKTLSIAILYMLSYLAAEQVCFAYTCTCNVCLSLKKQTKKKNSRGRVCGNLGRAFFRAS